MLSHKCHDTNLILHFEMSKLVNCTLFFNKYESIVDTIGSIGSCPTY